MASSDHAERERAWDRFVTTFTPRLLQVARAVTRDHDASMDAYAYTLGQLREDGFRRLLAYQATGGCSFETWLTVVTRRLCFDYHRHKYGRARAEDPQALEEQRMRRRLADLVAAAVEPELASTYPDPAAVLERAEILEALDTALGQLAPRDRLLLRYRFDDDLSARKIMRLMEFPTVFHVYRRLNALLAQCRISLQKRGFQNGHA